MKVPRLLAQQDFAGGLAIVTPVRSPALPNVPTTKEAGLPEYQVSAWNAKLVESEVARWTPILKAAQQ